MNSFDLLTIATLATFALACRYFALDAARERRRSARLSRDVERLYGALDDATEIIARQSRENAQLRHPINHGGGRPMLTVIDGGAR